ncbi:unnamed protein product [Ceutorhynchus assimilis]|uniref:Major facilitator superfamily (MFS) profile domain-containing protein n=1 Tax=Ceutorhynchus assimilis TaxID=467358 RepID=A0A9N9QMT7_9CUCU|nr:unnamed protein product [Ceutorhynchus assimilis]
MKLLYLLFALDLLNLAVFLPVFNPFSRSLGGTPFTIGLINSCSALVSLLWNPIVGSLSDQVGRKSILIKCLTASSIGSIVLAFSSSLTMVFIGKMIGALGSPVGILLRSTVADIYKTAEEKKAFFNKCAPIMSVAFLVGSLSSGFLSEAKGGFSMAFLLMASIMGLGAVIANSTISNDLKLKEQQKEKVSFVSKATKELKSAVVNIRTISWPHYKDLFLIKGFYDFSIATIFANVGLTMIYEFDVKGRTIGYIFMMTSLCRIFSNILKLKLKNATANVPDNTKIIIVGLIILVCYIIMSISYTLRIFVIFLGLMCICRAFMDTLLLEIIATRTTEKDRGKVMALANQNLASDSKQTKDKSKPKLSLIQKGIGELKKAAQDIKSISKPHYRRLFTIKACYDFATAIILANLGLIMVNEFNITGRYMGYVFLMTSVISIIANIVNLRAHSILKRIALSRMLFIGGSILTISYIGLGVSISSKTSFLTFMCLMCFANAFMDTTLAEMATSEAKEEERGKVISACENMVQLAQIIVPVLSGSVAEIIEQRFIVLSATVPMVTLMVVANSKVKTN